MMGGIGDEARMLYAGMNFSFITFHDQPLILVPSPFKIPIASHRFGMPSSSQA